MSSFSSSRFVCTFFIWFCDSLPLLNTLLMLLMPSLFSKSGVMELRLDKTASLLYRNDSESFLKIGVGLGAAELVFDKFFCTNLAESLSGNY